MLVCACFILHRVFVVVVFVCFVVSFSLLFFGLFFWVAVYLLHVFVYVFSAFSVAFYFCKIDSIEFQRVKDAYTANS